MQAVAYPVAEQLCTRTDHGWVVEARDLGWSASTQPPRVVLLRIGNGIVVMDAYDACTRPDGSTELVVYATPDGRHRLEVLYG